MQAKQTEESMTTDATATGKRPQTGATPHSVPRTMRAAQGTGSPACTDNYRNYGRNHDATTHMVHHWRQ